MSLKHKEVGAAPWEVTPHFLRHRLGQAGHGAGFVGKAEPISAIHQMFPLCWICGYKHEVYVYKHYSVVFTYIIVAANQHLQSWFLVKETF